MIYQHQRGGAKNNRIIWLQPQEGFDSVGGDRFICKVITEIKAES